MEEKQRSINAAKADNVGGGLHKLLHARRSQPTVTVPVPIYIYLISDSIMTT